MVSENALVGGCALLLGEVPGTLGYGTCLDLHAVWTVKENGEGGLFPQRRGPRPVSMVAEDVTHAAGPLPRHQRLHPIAAAGIGAAGGVKVRREAGIQ